MCTNEQNEEHFNEILLQMNELREKCKKYEFNFVGGVSSATQNKTMVILEGSRKDLSEIVTELFIIF